MQHFRDLRHDPFFTRVRGLFYRGDPPVSAAVEVPRFMSGNTVRVEVEATVCAPGAGTKFAKDDPE